MNQVGNDFGVGIRGEFVTGGFKLSAQFFVVFDDAVVNNSQAIGDVRVGIALTWRTMRGPAGVGDAGVTAEVLLFGFFGQVGNAAGRADTNQAITIKDGNAG